MKLTRRQELVSPRPTSESANHAIHARLKFISRSNLCKSKHHRLYSYTRRRAHRTEGSPLTTRKKRRQCRRITTPKTRGESSKTTGKENWITARELTPPRAESRSLGRRSTLAAAGGFSRRLGASASAETEGGSPGVQAKMGWGATRRGREGRVVATTARREAEQVVGREGRSTGSGSGHNKHMWGATVPESFHICFSSVQ